MEKLVFRFGDRELLSEETLICGIVNVTPDSFSDGGRWFGREEALKRSMDLIQAGAQILDIGGESTRPGSSKVSSEDEIARVVPLIRALREKTDLPISVDTWKADVAKASIEAGADIINDITGLLGDRDMARVIGQSKAGAILMFNPTIARPNHPGSKVFPKFGDGWSFSEEEVLKMESMDILDLMDFYFARSLREAERAGISRDRIMLDPGIGFGLTKRENLILIKNMDRIHRMGHKIFLGVSRKRFISNILEEEGFKVEPSTIEGLENRDRASAALTAIASFMGADVVRVHTVDGHRMAASVGDAVRLADYMEDLNFSAYKK